MNACVPTDRLMQTLRVHVPGATDALIELELFNVMDEFFRRTSAWRSRQEIELHEEEYEYAFALPANAVVVRLMGILHQQVPVPALVTTGAIEGAVGKLIPDRRFADGDALLNPDQSDLEGGLFSYAIYRPNYITLTRLPDGEARKYPLEVILALSVGRGCLECSCGDWDIEDWMWDMFFQDWLDGTLSRLYMMPSKPWTSPTLSVHHGKRFRNQMAFRKQESLRGYNFAQPIWRFPRWAS